MLNHIARTLTGLALVALGAACASAPPDDLESPEPEAAVGTRAGELPPIGYGTLRQDDFTVLLASGDVQIKLTPLDESVIRLAAPDTYQRLHGMVSSRRQRLSEAARNAGMRREPLVFLVSFFTYARQAEFEPTDLQLTSQGMLYRPIEILPLTPDWGRQQLRQQESQSALYLFDPAIDLKVDLQVEYNVYRTFGWSSIIRVLEAERGRVLSRAKS